MATTVTPSAPLSPTHAPSSGAQLPNGLLLNLLGVVAMGAALVAWVGSGLYWVVRRGVITAQTHHLNAEQYNALMALVRLQREAQAESVWWALDDSGLGDDCCTLNPRELQALKRCAAAGVSFDLIERFAPYYTYNSIIPRPD